MSKSLNEGDIFYVIFNGKYIFGKILMDISQRMTERVNPMKTFWDCYLVGIYNGIYDKPILTEKEFVIPSIYTQKKQFYLKNDQKTEWYFYKNEPIDYKKDINFPECITIVGSRKIYFHCGEVQLPTKLTKEDFLGEYDIQRNIHFWYQTVTNSALHYGSRNDLVDFTIQSSLEKEDLRFAEKQRQEVYKQIGEDFNISYYELALKHGFDLGRHYKNDNR